MKIKVKKNKAVTFASCGLNAKNNFLQAPKCYCGCGGYMNLVLKTKQEVYDFVGAMLSEQDCNHCAIFVLYKGGSATIGVKGEDGITLYGTDEKAKKTIADMQKKFQFHCYGLLEQVDADSYRIVMS